MKLGRYKILMVMFLLALAVPAGAIYSETSDGYKLWLQQDSGGKVEQEVSGSYLRDFVGYPIPTFVLSDSRADAGLWVITTGTTETTTTDAYSDNGLIRQTTIIRQADGKLKISWAYAPELTIKRAKIYRLLGAGKEYSWTALSEWGPDPIFTCATDGITEYEETAAQVQAYDGKNAYYRVVPTIATGVDDIFGSSAGLPYNERTVGKTDINLKTKYNSVCLPFDPIDYSFVANIADQLSEEDQVHLWSYVNQNYVILTKSPAGWPAGNFAQSEGFLVYLSGTADNKLCVVGQVRANLLTARTLQKKYESIGLPFPKAKLASQLGLTPREEDQIHTWNYANQNYEITTYTPTGWNYPDKAGLALGEGKLYYIPTTSTVLTWDPKLE